MDRQCRYDEKLIFIAAAIQRQIQRSISGCGRRDGGVPATHSIIILGYVIKTCNMQVTTAGLKGSYASCLDGWVDVSKGRPAVRLIIVTNITRRPSILILHICYVINAYNKQHQFNY